VATGPGGVGPGSGIPFSTEWLQKQKQALKEQGKTDATEKAQESDTAALSSDAKKLSSTKDERMLKTMRAELANLDTESETFMQEATEKLIDSVIDQEYGEHFKGKPGYANLQEKLTQTVLDNPDSRAALGEFFELLLLTEPDSEAVLEDEEESEGRERSSHEDEDEDEDEDYEEDEE
jgi:hypothetical protein